MKNKIIKLNDAEFIIGIPYTYILIFVKKYKDITNEDGDTDHISISPYSQWNAFMKRKINEGNRIIQNVNFTKLYGDDDDNHTIAVKFEVIYYE